MEEAYQRIALLKVSGAHDRSQALINEIRRVENRVYPSPASKGILEVVRIAAESIQNQLAREQELLSTDLLSTAEFDVRLQRIIGVLPLLHELLGIVEGSDVHHAPGQLIRPLRRYVQSVIPNSEILVSSKSELNYSIVEIAGPLRETFEAGPLVGVARHLPEFLFVINIPAVEANHILIHGILSHELGHALYAKANLAQELLPNIKVRDDLIQGVLASITGEQKAPPPLSELVLRKNITDRVTERITNWVMELSSDLIGIRIFGPAMFFAGVHLLSSFSHLDRASASHPPTRLRVKLMERLLKGLYEVEKWDSTLQQFLKDWDEIAVSPINARSSVDRIALESINADVVIDLLLAKSDALGPIPPYSKEQWAKDISELTPHFLALIPPGEDGSSDKPTPVMLTSIINAGWHVYLCHFDKFRAQLPASDAVDRLKSEKKLHELVLKALEISDTIIAWEEATLAVERGKNSGAAPAKNAEASRPSHN